MISYTYHKGRLKDKHWQIFLAYHPIPDDWELNNDFLGVEMFFIDILPPWEMHFDGAARRDDVGA